MHNIRKKKLETKGKTKLMLYTLIIFSLYAIFIHLLIHRFNQYNEVIQWLALNKNCIISVKG